METNQTTNTVPTYNASGCSDSIVSRACLIRMVFDFDISETEKAMMFEVDDSYRDESFGEVVWENVSKKLSSATNVDLPSFACAMSDASTGFDVNSIVIEFYNYDSVNQVAKSIEWVEKEISNAINEVRSLELV